MLGNFSGRGRAGGRSRTRAASSCSATTPTAARRRCCGPGKPGCCAGDRHTARPGARAPASREGAACGARPRSRRGRRRERTGPACRERAAVGESVSVALVEQPYRVAGRRSPAPASQLDAAWTAVVAHLLAEDLRGLPLIAGGRSMGARVACRTAAATGAVGVLCLAFPLVPPRRRARGAAAQPPPRARGRGRAGPHRPGRARSVRDAVRRARPPARRRARRAQLQRRRPRCAHRGRPRMAGEYALSMLHFVHVPA